jgi:hypothetical protein
VSLSPPGLCADLEAVSAGVDDEVVEDSLESRVTTSLAQVMKRAHKMLSTAPTLALFWSGPETARAGPGQDGVA